jgi:hypothetical protein
LQERWTGKKREACKKAALLRAYSLSKELFSYLSSPDWFRIRYVLLHFWDTSSLLFLLALTELYLLFFGSDQP